MNKTSFYKIIRAELFGGSLSQSQVSGIENLLKSFDDSCITDTRWKAYMLATAYHETAKTMQPIEEYGKGKGRPYGSKLKMSRTPYSTPDKIYYGRGYVQLTWYENYEKMGKLLNIDLLNHPELALEPDTAAKIMIEGMTKGESLTGDFTGVSLEKYFTETSTDWVNARRIINGLDSADKIAWEAKQFFTALNQE